MNPLELLILVYIAGLIAIGIVAYFIIKAIPTPTTRELSVVRSVTGWACAIATGWVFFGGMIVAEALTQATGTKLH